MRLLVTSIICLSSEIFMDVGFHCSVWSFKFRWRYLQCSLEHISPFASLILHFFSLPPLRASHWFWLCPKLKHILQLILCSRTMFHTCPGVMVFNFGQYNWKLCGVPWQKTHFPSFVFACFCGANFEVFCLGAFCLGAFCVMAL